MGLSAEQIMTLELQHGGTVVGAPGPPRDVTMARRGMVASAHHLASDAGLEMLRHGGNAIDAAVAAAALLTVVEPRNGHLGGDTFMLIHLAAEGRVVALNGSGAAPAAATLDVYRDLGGIPDDGLLSSTVPGTVSCWALALERYGTRSLDEVFAAAIEYADRGVPVTARLHRLLSLDAPTYRKVPDSAKVFLPDGDVPAVGAVFRQPALAHSLRRIAAGGRDEFYSGRLTDEMVQSSGQHGGLFTVEDFASHQTEDLEPVAIEYRGFTVFEQPPVSQGIIVLLALNILREFDLRGMGHGSTASIHLMLESLKLAFEDRLRYLGDPRHVEIPLSMLLSTDHARAQAQRISLGQARPLSMPDNDHPDTTSLVAADEAGNMVSYIHSLFSGAGVVLGDTGVLMNSRLLNFNLDEGHPNCLAPGKRPIHTLNPYLVQKDGEAVLVGGTPGAHWQVQTNLQILSNVLDFGLDPQRAIEAPRFTVGDQLDVGNPTVKIESRVGERVVKELRDLGHDIEVIGPWDSGGAVQLIARDHLSGTYRGATEVRRPGNTVVG
ncbi:MAG: gamma-glutamyltransferase, partial [Chloroflexota bacterium]|nr:gamma-glutamyltransferase [Chloroflexota bacterium]